MLSQNEKKVVLALVPQKAEFTCFISFLSTSKYGIGKVFVFISLKVIFIC